MQRSKLVIPTIEKEVHYKDLMAGIIARNDHDLVIEAGNAMGESEVHDRLKGQYKWGGRYVTVNPNGGTLLLGKNGSRFLGTPEDFGAELRTLNYSRAIHTKGDGLDNEHLEAILDISNPRHPVYTVNGAVGIILSYERDRWIPKGTAEEESVRKMAEIWARNLSKTRLERGYLTEAVFLDDSFQGKWKADFGGISRTVYELFCDQLKRNSWRIEERETKLTPMVSDPQSTGKLMVVYR